MAGYHVNDAGVPGKCGAQQGRCPFGGEAQHYSSAEVAQQAYELSMASQTIPVSSKALGKKPFDTTEAKRARPPYPIEGDRVRVHRDAGLHNGAFRGVQNQVGTVKAFNGSSYTVEFDGGLVLSGMNHQLVAQEPEQSRGWASLGEYGSQVKKLSLKDLDRGQAEVDSSSLPADEKIARSKLIDEARGSYHERKYGFPKSDLAFDEDSVRKSIQANWRSSSELTPERLERAVEGQRTAWEAKALTQPAKSHEKGIPIRLIPVGSEVYLLSKALGTRGRPYGQVGTPQDNGPEWDPATQTASGPHDIVGRYRDVAGEWDYVGPNTTFTLGHVPAGKALSPRWREANAAAQRLSDARRAYRESGDS